MLLVTGGRIASTFNRPDLANFGHCKLIEKILTREGKVCIIPLLQGTHPNLGASLSDSPVWLWTRLLQQSFSVDPQPNGRRGRAFSARCPFRTVTDRQRNEDRSWRRVFRDADKLRRRRRGPQDQGDGGHHD